MRDSHDRPRADRLWTLDGLRCAVWSRRPGSLFVILLGDGGRL